MTLTELKTAVNAFVATVTAGAADSHEAAVLLLRAKELLDRAWHTANQAAAEDGAALVLEKRAEEGGTTVDALKSAAALLLGKHPSGVSSLEVVNVKLMADDTPKAPAPGGK